MKQYFSLFLISERFCISTVEPLLLVRLLSPPGLQYLPTAKLPSILILWSPCQIFSDSLLSDCFLWSLLLLPVSSEIEMFSPSSHNAFQDWINPRSQPKIIEALISPWQQCKASSICVFAHCTHKFANFLAKCEQTICLAFFWPKGFNDARDENCSYL